MKTNKLVIGVVAHPKSKNPNPNLNDTIEFMQKIFMKYGYDVKLIYCNEDKYRPNKIQLRKVLISEIINSKLSITWYHVYLNRKSPKFIATLVLGYFLRYLKYLLRIFVSSDFRTKEKLKYKRSLNICYAHLEIISRAEIEDGDLLLILEDDSFLDNLDNLDNLDDIMKFVNNTLSKTAIASFLNLSKSLTYQQLQFETHYNSSRYIRITNNIFLPTLMFHNTTCANLYNSKYVQSFIGEWRHFVKKSVSYGIPFDWIINALVLKLPINHLLTFHLHKPVILQGSMYSKK